jgi:hypothetical protein
MRGIEHDQPSQLARRRGRNDLAVKAALCVGEQYKIYALRIKPEVVGIVLGDLAAALIEPAIDEDALAGAVDEVAGTGHVAIGAAELATRVLIMQNGRIVADGKPREILTNQDFLRSARLEPPILTKVFAETSAKGRTGGTAWADVPITVAEARALLNRWKT